MKFQKENNNPAKNKQKGKMPSLSASLWFISLSLSLFKVLEALAEMHEQGPDNKQMNMFNLWARWAVWNSYVRLCHSKGSYTRCQYKLS
jgi:hypothetical protein